MFASSATHRIGECTRLHLISGSSSAVERTVRDREVEGATPFSPTRVMAGKSVDTRFWERTTEKEEFACLTREIVRQEVQFLPPRHGKFIQRTFTEELRFKLTIILPLFKMEKDNKPKRPKLNERPKFCESCPLYRSKNEGCRLLRHLYNNNPTTFPVRVVEWNEKVKTEPQSVVSECSML